MPREPRDDDASGALDSQEGPREPRPIHHTTPVQLVSADEVEEAIASMLRIWGVYVTAGVLGSYRELLAGLPPRAVLEAVKRWLRAPPENRAARPHELRAMAEQETARQPPAPADQEAMRRGRATPAEIDQVFAEMQCTHPNSLFVRELLAARERYRRQWQEDARGQPMPASPPDA